MRPAVVRTPVYGSSCGDYAVHFPGFTYVGASALTNTHRVEITTQVQRSLDFHDPEANLNGLTLTGGIRAMAQDTYPLIGRLADGVSRAQAEAEIPVLYARWEQQFPKMHKPPEKSFVLPPDFREPIRSVLFFVGEEEEENQAYAMNGVKLEISRVGRLRMIGTDGNALSFAETACDSGSEVDLLIPEQTMAILRKLLEVEGGVMRYGGPIVQFEAGGRILSSRIMAVESFPDYRKVLPNHQTYAIVDRDEFRDAVRRMALCSNERHNGVHVVLRTGGIDMWAVSSDNDEAEDSVSAELTLKQEIKTGLDSKYLSRFLSAAPKGEIQIYFGTGKTPFDLRPGSSEYGFRCLVMPMNLPG